MAAVYTFIAGLLAGLALPFLLSFLRSKNRGDQNEVYENDDVMLNLHVASSWNNMGYWDIDQADRARDEVAPVPDGRTFARAAEALALLVARNAQLKPGDTIVDVGCGAGESLVLWLDRFKPKQVFGLTSLKRQTAAAQAKTRGRSEVIQVLCGDAARDLSKLDTEGAVNVILAIDCAYHFDTRQAFLRAAYEKLDDDDGRLSMTDICLPRRRLSLLDRLLVRLVCLGAGMPHVNMVNTDEYEAMLRLAGYSDIIIRDITSHVFRPLAKYIDVHGRNLGHLLDGTKWSRMTKFASLLRWLDGQGNPDKRRLVFVTVTARRKSR